MFDSFVAPTSPVTDYRTKFSGVRPGDLRGAPQFDVVKSKIESLLKGRILVGHAVHNDLEVLGIKHPEADIRDTSRYPPLMKVLPGGRTKAQALRRLAEEHLELGIQSAEHCSVEDARAALGLYQMHRKEWERWIATGGHGGSSWGGKEKRGGGGGALTVGGGKKRKKGEVIRSEDLVAMARNDYMADL